MNQQQKNLLVLGIVVVLVLLLLMWNKSNSSTSTLSVANDSAVAPAVYNGERGYFLRIHPDDLFSGQEELFLRALRAQEDRNAQVKGSSVTCDYHQPIVSPTGSYTLSNGSWYLDYIAEQKATKLNMLKASCLTDQAYALYSKNACGTYTGQDPNYVLSLFGINTASATDFKLLRKSDGIFGFMHMNRVTKQLTVVFRGTQTSGEWLNNTNFTKTDLRSSVSFTDNNGVDSYLSSFVPSSNWNTPLSTALVNGGFYSNIWCGVCSGFLNAGISFVKDFDSFVVANKSDISKVVFTGHSLGSAVAVIYALRLIYNHLIPASNVNIYTFSSPRVATIGVLAKLSTEMGGKIFAFRNRGDVVPSYPTTTWVDQDSYGNTGQYIYRNYNCSWYDLTCKSWFRADFLRYEKDAMSESSTHSLYCYFGNKTSKTYLGTNGVLSSDVQASNWLGYDDWVESSGILIPVQS